jgi:S-adenosylmethionine:tRNA ribosyltransferase-isomerase
MLLSDFDYHLPQKLIAQEQAVPRDSARLMLINRQTGEISHHHVYDLPKLLSTTYTLIANNTKVFPARLIGHKPTGGRVEILLTSPLGHSSYHCISRPGLKVGDIVRLAMRTVLKRNSRLQAEKGSSADERTVLVGTITHVNDIERTIKFDVEESRLRTLLSQIGTMPTPPYIKKLLGNSADYQTIYAKYGFSAAAPTAGLHFTPELLRQIKKDHPWHELTLNVGLGTFLPVKVDQVEDHHMHAESYTISPSTSYHLQSTNYPLLAIGTTTLRALESSRGLPGTNSTSIFIYPPYKFQIVDALMTNFHLPGSTLLMLVSAFCSAPQTPRPFTSFADSLLGRAYAQAISHNYRFFSFGDAMLII